MYPSVKPQFIIRPQLSKQSFPNVSVGGSCLLCQLHTGCSPTDHWVCAVLLAVGGAVYEKPVSILATTTLASRSRRTRAPISNSSCFSTNKCNRCLGKRRGNKSNSPNPPLWWLMFHNTGFLERFQKRRVAPCADNS